MKMIAEKILNSFLPVPIRTLFEWALFGQRPKTGGKNLGKNWLRETAFLKNPIQAFGLEWAHFAFGKIGKAGEKTVLRSMK